MNDQETTLDPSSNNAIAWNARYVADDIPWDKQAPCPGLVDWLAERPTGPAEPGPATATSTTATTTTTAATTTTKPPLGRWLVPGCGLGHDVQALNDAGAQAIGIDLSPVAAERAQALGREVMVFDLFDLPEVWDGQFDGVWEHTCFCAIHPEQRDAYATAVHRVLKPGGTLLGIFFEAEQDSLEGPPFKTRFTTVRSHFAKGFEPGPNAPESGPPTDWVPKRQHRAAPERMLQLHRV